MRSRSTANGQAEATRTYPSYPLAQTANSATRQAYTRKIGRHPRHGRAQGAEGAKVNDNDLHAAEGFLYGACFSSLIWLLIWLAAR